MAITHRNQPKTDKRSVHMIHVITQLLYLPVSSDFSLKQSLLHFLALTSLLPLLPYLLSAVKYLFIISTFNLSLSKIGAKSST